MTDDLVARLRAYDGRVWETTACYNGLREVAAASIEAAEARVRELEVELANQRTIAKYNREQAEKVERALAEAYERAAKVVDELVHPDPTYDDFLDGFRAGARTSAVVIRKLAQEVKHEAE